MSIPFQLWAQPSRDEGQQWARDELSDSRYRGADLTWFERIGRAIRDFLDDLARGASGDGAPWLLAIAVVVVLVLIGLVLWWMRRTAGVRLEPTAPRRAVFRSELDPAALRRSAHAAATAEDWRLAIQELVRAVFADQAHARRITIDRASTAQELAAASGTALPRASGHFTRLAALFDEVAFSGAATTRDDWDRCCGLDERIRAGTPAEPGSAPAAVPDTALIPDTAAAPEAAPGSADGSGPGPTPPGGVA